MDASEEEGRSAPSPGGIPGRDWEEQLDDYIFFVREQNRVPSQYAEDHWERTLCFWLRHQKASLRNGLLVPERAAKLNELLPGWNSPYRVRPSWDQMLARVVQFQTEQGRRPSASSSDAAERSLANWLYRQNAARTATRDRKHAERMAELEKVLPEGRPRTAGDHERWNDRLEQLLEYVRTNGRFPVMGPSSPVEEYALGKWVSVQRYALKKGKLYPERVARMDELFPGWRRS